MGTRVRSNSDSPTVTSPASAPIPEVIPNATNHLKLAIADATDPNFDSNVFLRAGSLTTNPPLTISEEEMAHGFDIIDRGLGAIE